MKLIPLQPSPLGRRRRGLHGCQTLGCAAQLGPLFMGISQLFSTFLRGIHTPLPPHAAVSGLSEGMLAGITEHTLYLGMFTKIKGHSRQLEVPVSWV